MPGRGRSSFTKRQKEHTRQQKQRDKAERRIQRKDEPLGTPSDSSELDLGRIAKARRRASCPVSNGRGRRRYFQHSPRTRSGERPNRRHPAPSRFIWSETKSGARLRDAPFDLLPTSFSLLPVSRRILRRATWSESGWPACFGRHARSAPHWPNPPACVRSSALSARSMCRSSMTSAPATKLEARPSDPARPVRPTRWMKSSAILGRS